MEEFSHTLEDHHMMGTAEYKRTMQCKQVQQVQLENSGLPLKLLKWSQKVSIFWFLGRTVAYCPKACQEADFYSQAVTLFPDKVFPLTITDSQGRAYYTTNGLNGVRTGEVNYWWMIHFSR